MARPVYMICSESGSEDKQTGLVSHFTVIEKIQFRPIETANLAANLAPGQPIAVPQPSFWVTALWMRGSDDNAEDWFDYSIIVHSPEKEPILRASGKFQFTKELHRFSVRTELTFAAQNPGMMLVQSQIRKVGESDWLNQEYPILVDRIDPEKLPKGAAVKPPPKTSPRRPGQGSNKRGKK